MDKDIETMVAEIEARAEKATPGPWKPKVVSSCYGTNGVSAGSCEDVVGMHGASAANAEFIAHAREDVPKLCAMWREQQKRIQDHEQWLDGLRAVWDIPKGTTIHEFMKAMALERDALRADATLWRNGVKILDELRATVIPCGHTVGDLIGGHGAVTKCGACLASIREHRATLATRLKAAIRRQTVDVDDGNTPNGPVEQAMETVANILNSTMFVATAKTSRRMLIETFARLSAAMAADCKELREAADAYFGEDFTRPPRPTQP